MPRSRQQRRPPQRRARAKETAQEKPAASPRKRRPAARKEAASEEGEQEQPPGEPQASAEPAKGTRRRSKRAQEEAAPEPVEKPLSRARKAPAGAPRRVLVSARARYVRTSPRKARMVCGHIRGLSVHEARAILAFTPRGVTREWSKLLESAVANAEHNHELLEDDLVVREAYADVGPTIKRYRPRALGRATSIHKRTSHLTITLAADSERK